jgi:hypothetical protein
MNRINDLRRNLILRLLVFEYDLYGFIELLDTIILGEAHTIKSIAAFAQPSVGELKLIG